MDPVNHGARSAEGSVLRSRPLYSSSKRVAWKPSRTYLAASSSRGVGNKVTDHTSPRQQQQVIAPATATIQQQQQQQWQQYTVQQPRQRQRRQIRNAPVQQQDPQHKQQYGWSCSAHQLQQHKPQHGQLLAVTPATSEAPCSSSTRAEWLVRKEHLQQHLEHSAVHVVSRSWCSGTPVRCNHACSSNGDNSNVSGSRKSGGDHQSKPAPTATSGAPPSDAAGSSSSNNSNNNNSHQSGQQEGFHQEQQQAQAQQQQAQQQQQQQPEGQAEVPSSTASDEIDAAVDAMLDKTWKELKKELKKDLPPEQAAMIEKWEVGDIQSDRVFREIAEQQLRPILELMGIQEDPYTFFIDMFKLALTMQLLSAAVVFYTAELGLGLAAGDAFRAVAGLTLGYFLRLSIKIEHLAWPVYNLVVQLLIQDTAVYEAPEVTAQEKLATVNKLGLTIACAFFIPKLLFGWQNDECWQIVVPMIGGLFFFDVCYILALLIMLWGREEE